ncbi:conserved hypothetical protein [Frankia canadensis]|uniref:Uncharacterized protein n=1 Tax=Frankia canadensis TaxID=1836972 RepID=A0A2I2KMU1_9ACTN|nr:hypothetical protein [Frankia canadensis]SNQ46962.1 conserved hypothetical protein [Frankia canadensis]SOU54252.1 conserved hypothetical protein [Frankia canadensis]
MTRDAAANRDRSALTDREAAILLVLLTQDQPVSNTVLKNTLGFTLTGAERRRLNDLRLVESGKVPGHGNVIFHEVTDAGWARAQQEMAPRATAPTGTVPSSFLFAIAAVIHRFVGRQRLAAGDVFRSEPPPVPTRPAAVPAAAPDSGPAVVAAGDRGTATATNGSAADAARTAAASAEDLELAIRAAYARLASGPFDWVRLALVRPLLGDAAKPGVDRVLRQMARQPDVRIVPDEDQKSLTAADHAAAVRIGDHDSHLLLIGSA